MDAHFDQVMRLRADLASVDVELALAQQKIAQRKRQ
jgi:hypothetical protein